MSMENRWRSDLVPAGRWARAAVLALLFGAAPAPAQEIDTSLLLREGDEFTIEVIRVREESLRPQRNGRMTTPVRVRVVSASPDGSLLEWSPRPSQMEMSAPIPESVQRAVAAAVGGLRLRLAFDSDGLFDGLANEREVLATLQTVADILSREPLAELPEEQSAQARAVADQLLRPEVLLADIMTDAETYFGLVGLLLEVGEELEVEIGIPHPLIAQEMPAVFHLRAESATDAEAVLVTRTLYDGNVLLEMSLAVLAQAGTPVTPEERATAPAMTMTDEGRYVLDRRTGLFREVVVERSLTLGPLRRHDRLEIRLTGSPRR